MPPAANGDSASQSPYPAGSSIGRFQLLRKLGQGGMGTVFLVQDPDLKRPVALKLLTSLDDSTGSTFARFQREAQALAKLSHPGIVAIHEMGTHNRLHFLVMDFVDGETFEEMLGGQVLSHRRIAEVLRDVALALHHAHGAGIIHRDVKPENVILDPQGRARLTDFGIASDESAQEQLTRSGEVVGTPAYLAPEQVSSRVGTVGPWTDVHALGAMLYRGLVGAPPFHAVNLITLLHNVLQVEPSSLRLMDPGIPPELDVIALKCLEKDPNHRYPSAVAVAEELERFLSGEPIQARSSGLGERAARWMRRNRVVSVVGVAMLFAGISGSLVMQKLEQDEKQRERLVALEKVRRREQKADLQQRRRALAAQTDAAAQLADEVAAPQQRAELVKIRFFHRLRDQGLALNILREPAKNDQDISIIKLSPDMTAEVVPHLAGLRKLQNLDFTHIQLVDADVAHIRNLTDLLDLDLGATGITDVGVSYIAEMVKLQVLNLGKNPITDAAMEHIEGMTDLRHLCLEETLVSDAGLRYLEKLTGLGVLYLTDTRVSDRGLRHLEGLVNLWVLTLTGSEITNAGLVHLKGLTRLKKLYLIDTGITDAGLEQLKGLRQLKDLRLGGTRVTDSGLEYLKGLSNLEVIDLGRTQVTDAGLVHLKGLSQLRELQLGGARVNDSSLEYLKGFAQLEILDLNGTQVTDAGVESLQRALPRCTIMH